MEALYYPSILGAGFFVIVSRGIDALLASVISVSFYFAIILLVYFSISFLLTTRTHHDSYRGSLFCLDLIEAVLLLLMFSALGFAETSQSTVHLLRFYWILLFIPALQFVWHWQSGQPIWSRLWAVLCGFAIAIAGICLRRYAPCVDWALAAALAALVFSYMRAL